MRRHFRTVALLAIAAYDLGEVERELSAQFGCWST
jgi:hypothetical protein